MSLKLLTSDDLREELMRIFKGFRSDSWECDFTKKIEKGIGFFPYGNGKLTDGNLVSKGGILILGLDFGTSEYFTDVKANGEAGNATVRNIRKTFESFGKEKSEQVFISNVFLGLRQQSDSNTSQLPPQLDVDFLRRCLEFCRLLDAQMKPSRVVTLGKIPEQFVTQNGLFEGRHLNIPHPSMWHFNLKLEEREAILNEAFLEQD